MQGALPFSASNITGIFMKLLYTNMGSNSFLFDNYWISVLTFLATTADPCTVCENNSTCVITDNSFKCVCPEGFSGPYCETGRLNLICTVSVFKYTFNAVLLVTVLKVIKSY